MSKLDKLQINETERQSTKKTKDTSRDCENRHPLNVVPHDQGFHFYTKLGDYCGVTAHSLEEFVNALQYVCSDAILFHFERGDFQKWIREVLGDEELALRIDDIMTCDRHLSADCCRKEIVDKVKIRISQLQTVGVSKFST
jgi:hypothetical protein